MTLFSSSVAGMMVSTVSPYVPVSASKAMRQRSYRRAGHGPVPCPVSRVPSKIIQYSDNLIIIHTIPHYFGCKTKECCEITINPPNRPIWFVDAPLWFADAAFCISKHPTSVKNHLHFRTLLPKALHNPNKCLTFAPQEPAKPLYDA